MLYHTAYEYHMSRNATQRAYTTRWIVVRFACSFVHSFVRSLILAYPFIRSFTSYVIPCKVSSFHCVCCDVRAYLSLPPARLLSLPLLLAHSCLISKHVVHTAHICVCMTMHFRVAWWTIDRYIYRCYYCCTYVCYCCVAVVAIQVLIRTCINLPLHRLHTHTCRSESVHQTVHQFTLFEYGVCVCSELQST